ncbi:hypothetical protein [Thauera sinica]|uniref:DUF2946 domain-containing protein n=1 Tax=Thauera sinica TaxID=2665146 RepID=A0ABW1ATI8_9RHOO|nr:hypothetical protein [Thauera sp. K11]ATE61378.1 hypothetical protein CCZ27_16765 [Thauera sp. K11]
MAARQGARRARPARAHASAAFGRGPDDGARALIARLLLALALVLAQTGALAHLVGHLADVPHARSERGSALSEDGAPAAIPDVCLDCLALGGLDLPLEGSPGHASFTAAGFAPPAAAPAAPARAAALRPRCRAPPLPG